MRARLFTAALIVCAAGSLLAGGCGHNLSYVHNASVGIDVTLATDGTNRIAIGYDSDTFAIVPKSTDKDGVIEAMSLVSVSNVEIDGLEEVIFNHVVITGEAAVKAANDEQGLKMMRSAVLGAAGTNGN
jgi:hypothetical protein